MQLPKRVFQSPLLRFANFRGAGWINLIRINKPYANGYSYAVYTTCEGDSNMFKSFESAKEYFDKIVRLAKGKHELTSEGVTGNEEKY